jgi:hypothetical protein
VNIMASMKLRLLLIMIMPLGSDATTNQMNQPAARKMHLLSDCFESNKNMVNVICVALVSQRHPLLESWKRRAKLQRYY